MTIQVVKTETKSPGNGIWIKGMQAKEKKKPLAITNAYVMLDRFNKEDIRCETA
jgi:hypothetical protein